MIELGEFFKQIRHKLSDQEIEIAHDILYRDTPQGIISSILDKMPKPKEGQCIFQGFDLIEMELSHEQWLKVYTKIYGLLQQTTPGI